MFKRFIASFVCVIFIFSNLQLCQAQDFNIDQLPVPGTMVGESVPFYPLALKGLIVNPQKPLEFQFIVDTGRGPQDTASVKDQANQLIKYFLAGLTIPEGDLWVNLSPYEKDRMVPEALGQTDLGRDLLAQDYVLKQLTASLIYPEKDLGKVFWSRVYAKAQQQFGTTNMPVSTFNKVWILPNQAQVYENGSAAYVTKSTLKVMLDEDYLALQKHGIALPLASRYDTRLIGVNMVREIILPEIEKEVNTGKNFAPLRQIYQALILAKWYKETIQNGLLDAIYTNKNKVSGVNLNDPAIKEQIYQRYLQAYKKGVFNYIKDGSLSNGQMMPRKYFSGGISQLEPAHVDPDGAMSSVISKGQNIIVSMDLEKTNNNHAMISDRAPGVMKAGGMPLTALKDSKVLDVFRQIIERRYDVRMLSEVYHLGDVPKSLTYKGQQYSVEGYAELIIKFLMSHIDEDPFDVSNKFHEEFPHMARPPELDSIFDAYMKVKMDKFDMKVLRDAIPPRSNVADIGAGKNRLGQAILEFSDENNLKVKMVIGTDLNDWPDRDKNGDERLAFVKQESGTYLPLPSNSLNVVIVKWVLHHMSYEDQVNFLRSAWRVLKPGGRLIIFDSLGSEQDQADIMADFNREMNNPQTWPQGSFYNDNKKLSEDFLALTPQQQLEVHALEDYFGHNLVMSRDAFMPQHFTYLSVKELRRLMTKLGFEENTKLRRVYGAAPIMRMGPPSLRIVFKKSVQGPLFIGGGGGENKEMLLIKGLKQAERLVLRQVSDVLVRQDRKMVGMLEAKEKVHDLVLIGNDRLDTFAESLDVVNSGLAERIVVLGESGRVTLPMIERAISFGYEVKISPTVTVNSRNWSTYKERITPENQRDFISNSESEIIKDLLIQMIQKFPFIFENLAKKLKAEGDGFIVTVGDSYSRSKVSTNQVLLNYRRLLDKEGVFTNGTSYKIMVVNTPVRELRSQAYLENLFSAERARQKVEILSHTVSYDNVAYTKSSAIKEIIREIWRLVIYSDYGKGNLNLRSEILPQGIDSLTPEFWRNAIQLIGFLGKDERKSLARELVSLAGDSNGLSLDKIIHSEEQNKGIAEFVRVVLNLSLDSAMLGQTILNDLQYRDEIPSNVKINDIVILGNDELNVFRHALGLWREHPNSRIVILGGKGRLTQPLIEKAAQAGFQIEDASSEAVIIKQIMKDMITEESQFADLKAGSIQPVFELEVDSTTTPENIKNYKGKIEDKLKQYSKGNPYHIIYLQTSHQQLRAKATVEKYLKSEIDDGRIIAFSDTAKYNRPLENQALDALGEAVRMIIYSDHGNGTIANENDNLPDAFWQNVTDYYNSFSGLERIQNASFLMGLIKGTKRNGQELNIDGLIKGFPENNRQRIFLELIKADSAMLDQLGGIDLDQIKVDRAGRVIKMFFDQAQLNELMQGGFEGFTPVITKMTRISSPFQFFNDKGINSI